MLHDNLCSVFLCDSWHPITQSHQSVAQLTSYNKYFYCCHWIYLDIHVKPSAVSFCPRWRLRPGVLLRQVLPSLPPPLPPPRPSARLLVDPVSASPGWTPSTRRSRGQREGVWRGCFLLWRWRKTHFAPESESESELRAAQNKTKQESICSGSACIKGETLTLLVFYFENLLRCFLFFLNMEAVVAFHTKGLHNFHVCVVRWN